MTPISAVLWQDFSKTITLLDIPRSISVAQGTYESKQICSSLALGEPYTSTEPKTDKAKANVARHGMSSESNGQEHLLREAVDAINGDWNDDWCLERKLRPGLSEPAIVAPVVNPRGESEPMSVLEPPTAFIRPWDLHHRAIYNPSLDPVTIQIEAVPKHDTMSSPFLAEPTTYFMPPASTFVMSTIDTWSTTEFSMSALTLLPDYSTTTAAHPGEFDFILLDPPWPNRSVRRSKHYESRRDPLEALKGILGQHIAPGGLVACWITNGGNARAEAMDAFTAWDVQLLEEWCWLKVTKAGQPVTEIGGVWRKPYEILLIGRKQTAQSEVKRRVIVAVPDIHSRKPSIKGLVEDVFGFNEGEYRGLEVFARGLTARWWAWGNECMRFQWEGWWTCEGEEGDNAVEGR